LRGQGVTQWLAINLLNDETQRVDMWFNANKFFFHKQNFRLGVATMSIIYGDRNRAMHKFRTGNVTYTMSWPLQEEQEKEPTRE
jgi:hypothetical protein